jgi:hypothetical protein
MDEPTDERTGYTEMHSMFRSFRQGPGEEPSYRHLNIRCTEDHCEVDADEHTLELLRKALKEER